MLRNTIVKTLISYPCILLGCYALVTVIEIWSFAYPDTENFEIVCLAEFFRAINGLLNAFVYGFNDAVRYHLGCGPRYEEETEQSDYLLDEPDINFVSQATTS